MQYPVTGKFRFGPANFEVSGPSIMMDYCKISSLVHFYIRTLHRNTGQAFLDIQYLCNNFPFAYLAHFAGAMRIVAVEAPPEHAAQYRLGTGSRVRCSVWFGSSLLYWFKEFYDQQSFN